MSIRVLDSHRAFTGAADRWIDLWTRSTTSDLFLSHHWLDAWWRAFATPEDAMHIVCVERAGRYLAALPLMRAPGRRLRSIFNHYSGRGGALIDPSTPEAFGELFAALRDARSSWDIVELEWFPEDSPAYTFLEGRAPSGLNVYAVRTNESPYLPMQGGFDLWYKGQFSAKTRSRDRGSLRDAADRPGFRLEIIDRPDRSIIDTSMNIEMLGWKGEARSAMKNDARASAFLHDVAARLGCVVTLLHIDHRPIAFVLGFVDRGAFYYYKTSFDPAYEELRPGRIVTTRAIEEMFARKLQRFDFLGAADEYKLRYTGHTRPHAAMFLYHRGLRSQAHRAMKRSAVPLAKTILGKGTLYPVRVDH